MVRETRAVIGMLMCVVGSAGIAVAQDSPTQAPASVQTQPTGLQGAPAQTQATVPQAARAGQALSTQDAKRSLTAGEMRKQALLFTSALQRAVTSGAEVMVEKARLVTPDASALLSGPTEVLFYRLPDYGMVFDVRVPGMRTNTAWALSVLLQMQQPPRVRQQQLPGQGQQSSGLVRPTALDGSPTVAPAAASPVPAPFVDPALLTDPGAVYTREVKNALVDAMIRNSSALELGSDEWLTVVAHDSAVSDPSIPGSQNDFYTVTIRIKGSDVNDFAAKRTSLEEARQRVKLAEN